VFAVSDIQNYTYCYFVCSQTHEKQDIEQSYRCLLSVTKFITKKKETTAALIRRNIPFLKNPK